MLDSHDSVTPAVRVPREVAGGDWWIDARMISPMRLVLAATALLVIYIDPSQPDRLVGLTYSLLVSYTIYSALILGLSLLQPKYLPVRLLHWLDLLWYVCLISVSSGTSSIFFLFFFFPILVASFRWGFHAGLRITIVSTLLFVSVGYMTAPAEPQFELNRFLLRAVTLLVLGYMIAHWGGSEIQLKRRLRLLTDVTSFSNPRFGVTRTIGLGLEKLRLFFDAQSCVLVLRSETGGYQLIHSRRGNNEPARAEEIGDQLAEVLLTPAKNLAIICGGTAEARVYDLDAGEARKETTENCREVADALAAEVFASIPVIYRGQIAGRLYVVDPARALVQTDVDLVLQVIQSVMPTLDNIRLLDRLASEAADRERQRLARDIHDSVIQPYVGLQLGLMAVRQKLLSENSIALKEIDELCEVANAEVKELRHYLDQLKAEEARTGALFPAVRRFVAKYSAATGITVEITGKEDLRLNDRLAAEVFQMIAEALSNVRRHTVSEQAEVDISCDDRDLIVKIRNQSANGGQRSFRPVSVAERAAALGGTAQAYVNRAGQTVVGIRIPL